MIGQNKWRESDVVDELHEKIKGMRNQLGPDVQIMIDNHGRSRPSVANRLIAAVEEFDITFFEEPVPPDNLDAMEQVRNAGHNMDIATGERLFFSIWLSRYFAPSPDRCDSARYRSYRWYF